MHDPNLPGWELTTIPVTRQFVEFVLFNDLLTARCRIFCKGYADDDDNYTEIFRFDLLETDGTYQVADHWHSYELWLYGDGED